MRFRFIQAGSFMMGSSEYADEGPVHEVHITQPFYLGIYPVTQEEWVAIMGDNPSRFKGPHRPVEQVSWEDVQVFLQRLNEQEPGAGYRLPSEAEWEFACRAGAQGKWSFGNDEQQLTEYAWFSKNANQETHPVGLKRPNANGLHDVHGNVWEWCQDWYDKAYYSVSPNENPSGPKSGKYRVIRGGGWEDKLVFLRSANRSDGLPGARDDDCGFRVLLPA